jgi:hypothetical protein
MSPVILIGRATVGALRTISGCFWVFFVPFIVRSSVVRMSVIKLLMIIIILIMMRFATP